MTDWTTISALATAAGTLALAGATFVAVRSAHASAHITERALLAGIRPVLLPPRLDDPPQEVSFIDGHCTTIDAGHAHAEATDDAIYMTFGLRNAGSGLAVLDRWGFVADAAPDAPQPDVSDFHRLTRDLYIPAGDVGFWQAALRDPTDPLFAQVRDAIHARARLTIDVLYGDLEGGQRTISRFALTALDDDCWLNLVARHWNVDRADPR